MQLTYRGKAYTRSQFPKNTLKSAGNASPSLAVRRSIGAFVPVQRPLTYGGLVTPHPTDWVVFQRPLIYRGMTSSPPAIAHRSDCDPHGLNC